MLRVAELIRHAMAELLTRGGIQDPVLETHIITVPKVKMSPDLKLATVYVLPLGGQDATGVIEALERHRKYLRGEIARKVNLKMAPEVRFRADDSFDNAAKIDALLRTEKVRKDIVEDADDSVDGAEVTAARKDGSDEEQS
jgi:ribosome-binding factor A